MNTDDFSRTEARALLERALEPEPVSTLYAEDVLRRARHGVRQRQTAMCGAAAAAVAFGAMAVISWSGQSVGPAEQALTAAASSTPCLPGRCPEQPSADPNSQRFTKALADANVFPAGVRVLADPESSSAPLYFYGVFDTGLRASALLQDDRGSGRVQIFVRDQPPLSDEWRCGAPREGVSCQERMLPDGSLARVTKGSSTFSSPDPMPLRLSVKRPNGTFIEAGYGDAPESTTRSEPILGVEDMFRIAGVSGLTY